MADEDEELVREIEELGHRGALRQTPLYRRPGSKAGWALIAPCFLTPAVSSWLLRKKITGVNTARDDNRPLAMRRVEVKGMWNWPG